jgi:hypothetical protein
MRRHFLRSALDRLARDHGTDKSSQKHDYMRFYEFFLQPLKGDHFTLLELGVGPEKNKGKSLLTWRDYFPNANIVGVDIRPDAKDVETDRITIEVGNCGEPAYLMSLADKYKPRIIIDDASHKWSHQILSLETLFSSLEPGGIFIMEDIQTSFEPFRQKIYADCSEDAFSYLVRLTHLIVGNGSEHPALEASPADPAMRTLAREIDSIAFYKAAAIVVKR